MGNAGSEMCRMSPINVASRVDAPSGSSCSSARDNFIPLIGVN